MQTLTAFKHGVLEPFCFSSVIYLTFCFHYYRCYRSFLEQSAIAFPWRMFICLTLIHQLLVLLLFSKLG